MRLLTPEQQRRLDTLARTHEGDGARAFTCTAPVGLSVDEARRLLMTWQVHERAGLGVAASVPRVERDAVVELTLGAGPFRVVAPCRVIDVIDQPGAVGFTYATLTGHPEAGEEQFVIQSDEAGARFTVSARSRHATRLARWAGPLTTLVQDVMTRRYLRVLA